MWIIVMFLSAVWTLILTAPIQCRGPIGEQVMLHFSKSVPVKKQTHLRLTWPEGEYIFIFRWPTPLRENDSWNVSQSCGGTNTSESLVQAGTVRSDQKELVCWEGLWTMTAFAKSASSKLWPLISQLSERQGCSQDERSVRSLSLLHKMLHITDPGTIT